MDEQHGHRIGIGVVQTVRACARTCVDELLAKLAAHDSMESLPPRRQELIERTTSALLRIIVDELQGPTGERGE